MYSANSVRYRLLLTLQPGSLYLVRTTLFAEEKEKSSVSELGHYQYVTAKNILLLEKGRQPFMTLAVRDQDTLEPVTFQGEEVKGAKSLFIRVATGTVVPDVVTMHGLYRCGGPNEMLDECFSGKKFPVAREGDFSRMQQACRQFAPDHRQPLLVTIRGHISTTPAGNETIIVDRFIRAYTNKSCDGDSTDMHVTDIYWKPVEINGQPVGPFKGWRKPFLYLDPQTSQMRGYGGCNPFFGAYLLRDTTLIFSKIGSTRMACKDGMDMEDRFFQALRDTEAYRLQDESLLLVGGNGTVLARLQGTR